MTADRRRPTLRLNIRGQVPIPPGQLGSDYELLERAMAARYKIVADIAFTLLLRRIKAGPMYKDSRGLNLSGRYLHTALHVENLPKFG